MIVPIEDFSWTSASPNMCFAYKRPLLKGERAFRIGMIEDERGSLDICSGAIEELAQHIGWVHPERFDELRQLNDRLVGVIKHMEDTQEDRTVRELARELDTVEAKLDDCIGQFNAAEERAKEQDIYIASLEEDLER